MTNFRYLPRGFTLDPLDFGRVKEIRWKGEEQFGDLELDQLHASRFQHRCAVEINALIRMKFGSVTDFASFADLSYGRFTRVLRGEVIMRLEDMAMVQRTLGLESEFDW